MVETNVGMVAYGSRLTRRDEGTSIRDRDHEHDHGTKQAEQTTYKQPFSSSSLQFTGRELDFIEESRFVSYLTTSIQLSKQRGQASS